MKLGVISDSHDNLGQIKKAVDIFLKNDIQALIHAGDFCSPFVMKEFMPLKLSCSEMHAVFGNNDGDRFVLARMGEGLFQFKDAVVTLEIGGRKIAVMHYPDVAASVYRSGDYDLVISGHTHLASVEGEDKKLLNPGSCSGYVSGKSSVAIVETDDMRVELVAL